MPFIPGRTLLIALLAPIVLSLAALPAPELVPWILVADGLILLLAAVDLAFVLGRSIEVTREAPETLSLARPATVWLDVRNRSRRRLVVEVNDGLFARAESDELPVVLKLDPRVVRRGRYRFRAMARGTHALGDHYVRYASPVGFWIRQLRIPAHHPVRVFPDVQAVRHYEMLARQNRDHRSSRLVRRYGGDTEFERLRDYLPDDEFRRIDWRASARRRKLTVRDFQLEKDQNVVFMLDCGRMMTAVWEDLTALDHALNAVLMLAHVAIRRGDHVGLIAFAERVNRLLKPRAGISGSNQIIQATFDLFPSMVEADYDAAFRALKVHMRKRTLVVFITHALDEETAQRIQRLSRDLLPQHLPLVAILKDGDVEARALELATSPGAACVQGAAAEMLLWRDKVHREMERAGVLVVDVLPRQLTSTLVSRYLEVKTRGLI